MPSSPKQAAASVPPLPAAAAVPKEPPEATTVPAAAPPPPPPRPVRLTFAPDAATLSDADADAVRSLAHAIATPNNASVSVLAHASGKPDDPSTPRRLSLARGLAVRSVLLESGVPSAQIYVRAIGAAPGDDGPADRVDVSVGPVGVVAR